MRIKTCAICEEDFDLDSPAKRKAGGLIINCADCSEETEIKYAGVQASDGKQAQATILKFNSEKDKMDYIDFWKNNSGWHKNKGCQLGSHLSTDRGIKFQTVVAHVPTNHKGKAD